MHPARLHLLIVCAVTACKLPVTLGQALFTQALRQYHARCPLAGCVLTQGEAELPGFPHILPVGRN